MQQGGVCVNMRRTHKQCIAYLQRPALAPKMGILHVAGQQSSQSSLAQCVQQVEGSQSLLHLAQISLALIMAR